MRIPPGRRSSRLNRWGGRIRGVIDQTNVFHSGRTVVITTGTFLGGLIHIGDVRYPAGRVGEIASLALSSSLRELGFEMGRTHYALPAGPCHSWNIPRIRCHATANRFLSSCPLH